jgi:hypothetical protein
LQTPFPLSIARCRVDLTTEAELATLTLSLHFVRPGPTMLRLVVAVLAFSVVLSAQAQAQAQPVQPPAATTKPAAKKPAPPKKVSASQPAIPGTNGPCVGVIPVIGDRFEVKKIGITVFGNEYKVISVDNWGFDDLVVERVRAAVDSGMAVRKIAPAQGAFDGYRAGTVLIHFDDDKSAALVQQVAGQMHCARYVVVTKGISQYIGNQPIYGVGVVNSGGPLLNRTHVHAVVRINVHDGSNFAVLKRGEGSLTGANLLTGPPTRKLDDFVWPETPEAANTPAVRSAARGLLAEVLDKSLPGLLFP